MVTTEPVLVMAFNRPGHLAAVLDRLREVRPAQVFLAVDGPRSGRADDAAGVEACRALAGTIDWECDVQTLFQEVNLGCGPGVSTAISWFFSHVERGIILEDDIVPDPSFFGFCSELLERYQDDLRVFSVGGCNVVPASALADPQAPYRFSNVPLVWGWATWRRSWLEHRLDATGWHRQLTPWQLLRRCGLSIPSAAFWASEFELTARGDVDTWDWQLVLAAMRTGKVVATSNVNLVANIGFDDLATHTTQGSARIPAPSAMALPTRPVPVVVDRGADAWARKHFYRGTLPTTLDRVRTFAMSRRAARA